MTPTWLPGIECHVVNIVMGNRFLFGMGNSKSNGHSDLTIVSTVSKTKKYKKIRRKIAKKERKKPRKN